METSVTFITDWFKFQFNLEWREVLKNVFKWLARKEFKRGAFQIVDTTDVTNPWPSRFYSYDVKVYPGWNDKTVEFRLHPYAWIILFKQNGLL